MSQSRWRKQPQKTFMGQLENWKYGLAIIGYHGIIVNFLRHGIIVAL